MNEFKTPRFVLAAFFSFTMTIAYLFTEKMSSDQYIMVMSIILGLYGATALTKKLGSRND
ncbi:MAG: hypothetical protein JKY93_12580 [Gammaproteobacteria bacterium]|nr:hypothetical protein [Gammaproteobacteria bacterium]